MTNYAPSLQFGDGSKTNFVLPWPYLDKAHVTVSVAGVFNTTFTWVNASTILITPAPANLATVNIYRNTPGDVLVNFNSGYVKASDQNYAYKQALFRADEGGAGGSGSGAQGPAGATGAKGDTGASGVSNYTDATATVPSKQLYKEATNNGANKVTVAAPVTMAADADVNLPGASGDILSTGETKNLTKGFTSTAYPAGVKSSGTFIPDPSFGNLQTVTNNGVHAIAVPTISVGNSVSMALLYTNGATAGLPTTSAFNKVTGSFDTVSGSKFICFITVIAGFSHLNIVSVA